MLGGQLDCYQQPPVFGRHLVENFQEGSLLHPNRSSFWDNCGFRLAVPNNDAILPPWSRREDDKSQERSSDYGRKRDSKRPRKSHTASWGWPCKVNEACLQKQVKKQSVRVQQVR